MRCVQLRVDRTVCCRRCDCHCLAPGTQQGRASRRDLTIGLTVASTTCHILSPATGGAAVPAIVAKPPWAEQDSRRMLHPVIVVDDIKAVQKFYATVLGMESLRYRSFPDGSANGFSGYLPEEKGMAFELVQKAGKQDIDIGSGFRHFSVAVPSIEGALQRAMDDGYEIVEGEGFEAGEIYIRDPSGYLWEVLPAMGESEPVREINILVSDVDESVKFYTQALGMHLVRTESTDSPAGYKRAFVSWGNKGAGVELALTQPATPEAAPRLLVEQGTNSYVQVAVSTKDVYKTTEVVRASGGTVVREPGPVPGIGTKVAKVADPDGWVVALVDIEDFNGELCKAGSGSSSICQERD